MDKMDIVDMVRIYFPKTLTLALNDTHFNSYSVSSDPLEIGPEVTWTALLDNPFHLSERS